MNDDCINSFPSRTHKRGNDPDKQINYDTVSLYFKYLYTASWISNSAKSVQKWISTCLRVNTTEVAKHVHIVSKIIKEKERNVL